MAKPERIPLVEALAERIVDRLFDRFRTGVLQLPSLSRVGKKDADLVPVALWRPGNPFDTANNYALGIGQAFDRRGTVLLKGGDRADKRLAENIYQIRVRILTDAKVNVASNEPIFKVFVRELRVRTIEIVNELALSNEDDFAWLRGYGPDGKLTHGQVKGWFNFSSAPPPRLLPAEQRRGSALTDLRPGDVIFHGDEGGHQDGTLALAVECDGRLYGLSAAHVVSLHGRAALETDIFVRKRGSSEESRRRCIGGFAGPADLPGTFQDESVVIMDAALIALTETSPINEFQLAHRWRRITSVANIAPSNQSERPPVLIIKPGPVLQVAEVAAINFATPMLGDQDCLLFYEGLIELRKVKRNAGILPEKLISEVKNPNRVSRPGDSGSVVLQLLPKDKWHDREEFIAVGMVVGGNTGQSGTSLAYAIPMTDVQEALDFKVSAQYKATEG